MKPTKPASTKEFMKNFPDFHIQTFDDKKSKRSCLTTCGTPKSYTMEKLLELNQKGAGIFFSPNRFPKVRKQSECTGVNAWFFEIDGIDKEEQIKRIFEGPLMPSFFLDSRNSKHCYFLAKDGSIDNFRRIQEGLIHYYGADNACKDLSRVLRIPGYMHNKEDPYPVEIEWETGEMFTEAQMLKNYPLSGPDKSKPLLLMPPTGIKPIKSGSDIWTVAEGFDCRWALEQLSGSSAVRGETFTFKERKGSGGLHIAVNGKPCNAWIDTDGKIGSGSNAGPSIIQWLEYYGHSKADIAKILKENFANHLPLDKFSKKTFQKEPSRELEDNNCNLLFVPKKKVTKRNNFTWGTPRLDEKMVPMKNGEYVVLVGETCGGKTAYSHDMAIKNAKLGYKVLFLTLEMTTEQIHERTARSYAGISLEEYKSEIYPTAKKQRYEEKLHELATDKNLITSGFPSDKAVHIENVLKFIDLFEDIDLAFIDNLNMIDATKSFEFDEERYASKKISNYVKHTQLPIVVMHHFRKKAPGTKGNSKMRSLDDLRGSAKVSQDASMVLQVGRNIGPELTDRAKSEFIFYQMKTRHFTEDGFEMVYFNKGSFYDNYVPPFEDYSSNDSQKEEDKSEVATPEYVAKTFGTTISKKAPDPKKDDDKDKNEGIEDELPF